MYGFIGIGVFAVFNFLFSISFAANPYKMGQVDFFDQKTQINQTQDINQQTVDFRESAIGPDGKLTYYSPPQAMLTLLELPTVDNARAYIFWQKQKMQRILKAQEAINKVLKDKTYDNFGSTYPAVSSSF